MFSSSNTILGGASGFAMTADTYSNWHSTEGFTEVSVHISWLGAGTPVGAWKIEVSNDPVCATENERIKNGSNSLNGQPLVQGAASAAKKVDITANITPVLGTGFTVAGGTDGDTVFALTGGVPRYIRVWFDYTSGGSAASLGKVHVHKG